MMPLITFTSDFGVQSQGIGLMHAMAFSICPQAKLIDLMHGLPPFDLIAGARTLETVRYAPIGFHVCVCDPGVGTDRKGLICETIRGDFLIGPDNGVLMPAARILGGIRSVHEITNRSYMNQVVSPIFHGRDVFAPAAAHLASGISITEFGDSLEQMTLVTAPYSEAVVTGSRISAQILQINRFGSVHLNILHETWDQFSLNYGDTVSVRMNSGSTIDASFGRVFADSKKGAPILLKDDYGRVELAVNLGSFVELAGGGIAIGQPVTLDLPSATTGE